MVLAARNVNNLTYLLSSLYIDPTIGTLFLGEQLCIRNEYIKTHERMTNQSCLETIRKFIFILPHCIRPNEKYFLINLSVLLVLHNTEK